VSRLADKSRFKEQLKKLIDKFKIAQLDQSFFNADDYPTLEHVTRRHFIDPFLELLEWDLSKLNQEMIEEARTRGETTLRLDYLGVNQQTRMPILIVEAKAWAAPFVAPSRKEGCAEGLIASQPISLICAAIEHHKAGGEVKDSPVTQAWADYLAKLHQYVRSVRDETGHIVTRLAILSGQWLVTFSDPESVFLTPGKVNHNLIYVFQGEGFVTQAESIFDQLARSSINDVIPPMIRPSLLHAYIRVADIKHAYHALWISRHTTGVSWKPRPSLDFEVAMLLERQDGALLTVIDQSLQGCPMTHNYPELSGHIVDIEALSDELLRRINEELCTTLQPSSVESFPGFPISHLNDSANAINLSYQSNNTLIKMAPEPGEFLLVTGVDKHFLIKKPTVDPCAYHNWAFCQKRAQAQEDRPILSRSVEPKSFFIDGEAHHCTHRLVHDRRDTRCQIDAFEEFLCCRTCVLQIFCWHQSELRALPCGTIVTAAVTKA
jgi:hypothetical protein